MAELSNNIIFEILTRASLQILASSRLVSREWNSMTYESSFIDLHCQRTKTVSGFFIQDLRNSVFHSTFFSIHSNSKLSLNILPTSRIEIEASSNQGMLLCKSRDCFFLCKPSTKQWKPIPFPNSNFIQSGSLLILRSNPLRYKIILLTLPEDGCSPTGSHYLQPEIFDSETETWKSNLEKIKLPSNEFLDRSRPIVAGGAVHWQTSENNILLYDSDKETWGTFSPPEIAKKQDYFKTNVFIHTTLVNYEGKLGLICMERGKTCMEIWVMKRVDIFRVIWHKIKSVTIAGLKEKEIFYGPISMDNSQVVVIKGFMKVIFYSMLDSNYREFIGMDAYHIFPFKSDFESVLWENEDEE